MGELREKNNITEMITKPKDVLNKNAVRIITTCHEGGYDMYRVPGIITASNGDILLYFEGRQRDEKRRSLLMVRSKDNGKNWSDIQILKADNGIHMLHNPLMLCDQIGRVFLFWNVDYRRLFYQISGDSGYSWGEPCEITDVILDWRRDGWNVRQFAVSCGHGISTKNGELIVPLWMSSSETAHSPAVFATISSQDGGRCWSRSNIVGSENGVENPTEGSIVECEDGRLLATLRHGSQKDRKRAFVQGRINRWGIPYLNETLPDPICAGSLLRMKDGSLLFSNCAFEDIACLEARRRGIDLSWSKDARQNLRIRRGGRNPGEWNEGLFITKEAGYSDLGQSTDGKTVYCFFEQGWIEGNCILNKHLVFLSIPASII